MILERVPAPTVRFIAVAEQTTDRVVGIVVGLCLYFLSFGVTLAVLIALFGLPGAGR